MHAGGGVKTRDGYVYLAEYCRAGIWAKSCTQMLLQVGPLSFFSQAISLVL
jgi:hypothetical protein